MMDRLATPKFMSFPLRIGSTGADTSGRAAHVREQIEQVLFTGPGERVFRPEFGAGVRALVFEPNREALWQLTRKRLLASLTSALIGEVDPKTITVDVTGESEQLRVVIAYALATIGHKERQEFLVSSGS